jgi:hypothetical protein
MRNPIMYLKSVVRTATGQATPIYEGTGTRVNSTATLAATAAAALPGTGTNVVEIRATDAIWIKFGIAGVTADTTSASILWTPGSDPLVVPVDANGDPFTHFSCMRVGSADVAVQIEQLS